MELTVLMPCLNEALTIATCIRKAQSFLERYQVEGEIVIADNGSTDGSQDIARGLGARVVDVPARGYGAALIRGIEEAKGRFVIMGDSDDSYDFSQLDAFVDALRSGAQLVMGNRFRGGIAPGAMPPLHRWLGNPVLSTVGRTLFGGGVRDFHCGLRGFHRDAVRSLGLRCPGMEFASEMVVKASLHGLRTEEVPTTLSPDGRDRPPHLRSWRDGWRHLRFLLLFSPRWLFFYPGLALAIAGALGQAALLPGPIPMSGITLDIHTMLYAAAASVIGVQLIAFAVFAEVFAVDHGVLPTTRAVKLFSRWFSVEAGLIVGLLLAGAGCGLSISAILDWNRVHFGDIDPRVGMRLVIPALSLLMVGVQVLFTSMFLGVLGLREHALPSRRTQRNDNAGLAAAS